MTDEEKAKCRNAQNEALKSAFNEAEKNETDWLILDEALSAIEKNTLCCETLLMLLKNKPKNLEVVITGRNPSQELIKNADYVTEMKKIKHPFDRGIKAREGIKK